MTRDGSVETNGLAVRKLSVAVRRLPGTQGRANDENTQYVKSAGEISAGRSGALTG
ncbi:hypothetical protein OS42_24180 [Dickeya oryzae]